MNTNRKYVTYKRVSKDSHESGKSHSKGLGLESQDQIMKHFYGFDIVKEFTETKSAKNITDRPVLREAIKYCLDNNCWLAVAKLDRLSRCVDDVRSILKVLDGNISFGDIPAEGKADIFTITIYSAFAERERDLISIRTKQALKIKREREGNWITKSSKWQKHQEDFVKSGEFNKMATQANKKKAESNENNIRASEIIADKRKQGLPFADIAEILNKSKFGTSEGSLFHAMQVKRIYDRQIAV